MEAIFLDYNTIMMINSKANITVLISLYNSAHTLERTFESLRDQTWQEFCIVAVNDGSTDDTVARLNQWQSYFGQNRFLLINNETNIGLTRSLNAGLKRINTQYTARLDADDWWHATKLAEQRRFLEEHPSYGLIGCNYTNVTRHRERQITCPEDDAAIRKRIFIRNPFAHSCVVFNTALVQQLGGYDMQVRFGQDYDLWLRLLPHTKMYNLQSTLCYRNAEGGISQTKQNAQMRQCIRTQLKYLKTYNRPLTDYVAILEPLIVILTPNWIKRCKRAHL